MIVINTERCDGCSACVEVCPTGALYLVDGTAAVDETLCNECEACVAACPADAISGATQVSRPATEPVGVPAPWSEPEVIRVKTH